MRKTKRFTPDLIDRYKKIGRGLGIFEHYLPWHRVGRSDPSSIGRSHLQMWKGRHRELLSDGEWVVFQFCTMLQNVIDIREQFPLQYEEGKHELFAYHVRCGGNFPGTRQITSDLGLKHPRLNGNGRSANWVMTTDLLLTLSRPDGSCYLLAISYKPVNADQKKRTKQLLEIERAYWNARGVEWLLITSNEYLPEVAFTLRNCIPWALGLPVSNEHITIVTNNIDKFQGYSLTSCLLAFAEVFGSMDDAQRAFWQSVWSGKILLDLTRGWRPHLPISLISSEEFWKFNPIASRRTSWN